VFWIVNDTVDDTIALDSGVCLFSNLENI